jgi:hypothetical protein
VSLNQLAATINYHDLVEGSFELGPFRVTSRYLNHPALTLGYKLEVDGAVLVYATDHEPHTAAQAAGFPHDKLATGALPEHPEDLRHAQFLEGADLVIHDAQYTAAEYPSKTGWGHSTVEYVVDMALTAKVPRLALFHHDPGRTDEAIDRVIEICRDRASKGAQRCDVFAAAEGQSIELRSGVVRTPSGGWTRVIPSAISRTAAEAPTPVAAARSILLAVSEAREERFLREALAIEGFELACADGSPTLADRVRLTKPALVLLGADEPDALASVKSLRSAPDPLVRDVPLVVVGPERGSEESWFTAGATDVVPRPLSTAYVRSRVRAWLLRTRGRWEGPPLPANEAERLEAVRTLKLLDTPPDERFDRITRLAARLFNAPAATIGLMDNDRLWYKSRIGFELAQVPRDLTLCAFALVQPDGLVVPDVLDDDRYADMPRPNSSFRPRFYAGQPLHGPRGLPVGTLCVMDSRPRMLSNDEQQVLRDLAALVDELLRQSPQLTRT